MTVRLRPLRTDDEQQARCTRVKASFLTAEAEGALAGRVSIRHELNDFLASFGGHIGYCVLEDTRLDPNGVRKRRYWIA